MDKDTLFVVIKASFSSLFFPISQLVCCHSQPCILWDTYLIILEHSTMGEVPCISSCQNIYIYKKNTHHKINITHGISRLRVTAGWACGVWTRRLFPSACSASLMWVYDRIPTRVHRIPIAWERHVATDSRLQENTAVPAWISFAPSVQSLGSQNKLSTSKWIGKKIYIMFQHPQQKI